MPKIKIPKKIRRKIKRELGQEGLNLFQLLTELADENGEIRLEGSEDEAMEQLAKLYEARFGGS